MSLGGCVSPLEVIRSVLSRLLRCWINTLEVARYFWLVLSRLLRYWFELSMKLGLCVGPLEVVRSVMSRLLGC